MRLKLLFSQITSMTGLQSFSPEICSLICQDPILERLDLNSICFISHAFRNEAQRELFYQFPCVRGVRRVKAWCLSLQSRPHIATNVKGLVLLLPQSLRVEHIERLTQALHMCVNLKELVVLFQERHLRLPGLREPKYSSSSHMLIDHPFRLTKFVNGYFSQDDANFGVFLISQKPFLESLELHSGETKVFFSPLDIPLKSLACPTKFLFESFGRRKPMRLRFDIKNSLCFGCCPINRLGSLLMYDKKMTNLAIFSKQKQSHFSEIMTDIARNQIDIRHIEIHEFFPTPVSP